ncbi:hypothetical protein VPNG_09414 [Cytospora leucostoma]|uniref:Uncharacterized protein n=1 Tax=Cytospora leucostoma TaxID=1230097 RepID=A0A423VPW5_9PEZI|nr:hypothetical protein VPNG_09414 [Cytospora leucostoma]
MTTRNLNTTWRDIVFKQYAADFEAEVPFPVRYLINVPVVYGLPGRDIWIEVQTKIDLKAFKKAIVAFHLATRLVGDPTYQDDHISVRPRLPKSEGATGTDRDDGNDDAEGARIEAGSDAGGKITVQ